MTREFICRNETETYALGKRLASFLEAGMFVALYGDLGTGKTAFVKGIGGTLGSDEVTSPTFTIVQEYDTEPKLYHFDVYRLSGTDELYAMGYEDYLDGSGVILMEWAELVPDALPAQRLDIRICKSGEDRIFHLNPLGAEYERMVGVL